MNEMLANQYFIAERFKDACEKYKEVLKVNPTNTQVKKKLILCYIQIGKVQDAFELFLEIITTNINTIIENEKNIYNQPCKKMIYELEHLPSDLNETDKMLVLGMLWMYCDINQAIQYFRKLITENPNDLIFKKVLNKLLNS
jgi:tetratricopeptide (TPR) repeat protein